MKYLVESGSYLLPSGTRVYVSQGAINLPDEDCLYERYKCPCNASAYPPFSIRQTRVDTGHYPVWIDSKGMVFLSWEEIGDEHLANIHRYITDVRPYLGRQLKDVQRELAARGLDIDGRTVR